MPRKKTALPFHKTLVALAADGGWLVTYDGAPIAHVHEDKRVTLWAPKGPSEVTHKRLNAVAAQFGLSFSIWKAKRGIWRVSLVAGARGGSIPFESGMTLPPDQAAIRRELLED